MTSKAATNTLGDKPRQGKWTKEEEAYVDLLIEEFRCGALPLREGTTLRSFLSKMINCNPKRVSKKYENTNYNGKHKYEPSTIPMSLEEMRRRRERLQDHERRFLEALKRGEDDLNLDEESPAHTASLDDSRRSVASTNSNNNNNDRAAATGMEDQAMAALLEQHKQKATAACTGTKRSSILTTTTTTTTTTSNRFQDHLTAELQSRMDLANNLSGSPPGCQAVSNTTDMRDLSLTNTANMTLTLPSTFTSAPAPAAKAQFSRNKSILPSAFASPPQAATSKPQVSACIGGNTSLNQLASFDLMTSLKQSNPSFTKPTTAMSAGALSGNLAELEDDPLGWQVRLQRRAALTNRAQSLLRDQTSLTRGVGVGDGGIILAADNKMEAAAAAAPFPLPPYLRGQSQRHQEGSILKRGEMPFPGLMATEAKSDRRRSLHPAGTMDHLSQLQLATLVAREERRSSGFGMTNQALESARRSSLVSELEMMESLKRGRERQEAMDSLRPFKRLR